MDRTMKKDIDFLKREELSMNQRLTQKEQKREKILQTELLKPSDKKWFDKDDAVCIYFYIETCLWGGSPIPY